MGLILVLIVAGFLVVAGGVVAGGTIAYARRRRRLESPAPLALPAPERNPLNLRVRDIVTHLDRDYIIVGRIVFREAGRTWYAYRLQDGLRIRWLRATMGDTIQVIMVEREEGLDFATQPPERIAQGLVTYRLVGRGDARVEHSGSTGREELSRVEWFDYEGPADHVLYIERWGARCSGMVGRSIDATQLEFLPGDLVEA